MSEENHFISGEGFLDKDDTQSDRLTTCDFSFDINSIIFHSGRVFAYLYREEKMARCCYLYSDIQPDYSSQDRQQ